MQSPLPESLPRRDRLPDRREIETADILINNALYTASAGFDPATGAVREVFLAGAKVGSAIDGILGDAAVVISVALQHGVPVEALAKSVARTRTMPLKPEDLDSDHLAPSIPSTVIGATLEFLRSLNEIEEVEP